MKFPSTKTVKDENGTRDLAEKFADVVKRGQVIVLNGNLGSGKTFFIKSVLHFFSISNVSSPSFAIVNEYIGSIKAYHFDFFRLKDVAELHDIGWQDYLNDTKAVTFIEWGDQLKNALPKKRIEILVTATNDTERQFDFMKYE
ncbi:MAG: tRNA (adenosine(37)-N6)-threonylcarbamoyltransferase complex ATPase subunit type 1 TsaE [Ignavibacterium sp.]|nr:MAG: tRNA (adenosine(37)-N6)-threonylcarbamoyltransferase complex ATPase subunit type 1 TsaE [Ignavibacterium sp.]